MHVHAGVYLLAITNVHVSDDSYAFDLYLNLTCDQPCDPGRFDIMNGTATQRYEEGNDPNARYYRIQATLYNNLKLTSYPFEKYKLSFAIEDQNLPNNQLVYDVDTKTSGLHPGVLSSGWKVSNGWEANVSDDLYTIYDQTYSRYTFSVTIQRPVISSWVKGIFPGVVIVVVGFFALFTDPEDALQRIFIGTSALLGAIVYHLTLTSSIPPVGYLTFGDRFMMVNYLALGLVLGTTVAMLVLRRRHKQHAISLVHITSMWAVPAVWIVLQGANFLV